MCTHGTHHTTSHTCGSIRTRCVIKSQSFVDCHLATLVAYSLVAQLPSTCICINMLLWPVGCRCHGDCYCTGPVCLNTCMCHTCLWMATICCLSQEPKFVSGEEKARKLFDFQNFAAYFDTEVLGELEGQELMVRVAISFPNTLILLGLSPTIPPPLELIEIPLSNNSRDSIFILLSNCLIPRCNCFCTKPIPKPCSWLCRTCMISFLLLILILLSLILWSHSLCPYVFNLILKPKK